jgi:hypothetical protein
MFRNQFFAARYWLAQYWASVGFTPPPGTGVQLQVMTVCNVGRLKTR